MIKKELFTSHISCRTNPANIDPEDYSVFAKALRKEIPNSYFYLIKNCIIYNNVILEKGLAYFGLTESYQKFSRRYKLALWLMLPWILFLKKDIQIDCGVWIYRLGCGGYFHWMTEALPQLLSLKERMQGRQVLVPQFYKDKPYVRNSLKFLGMKPCYLDTDTTYRIEDLVVPGLLAPSGNYNESVMRQLRTKLTREWRGNNTDRLIYVSRKKRNKRVVLNEEDVIRVVKDFGFEVVCFEDYELEEQFEIAAQSKVMVSIHGAGLTNMLGMKEGGAVFELRRLGDTHNNCYFSLASALNLTYYYQLCEGDHQDTHIANLRVNIAVLKENISKLLVSTRTVEWALYQSE